MNLYGIENRSTIGKAIKIADSKTTLNEMLSLNLKYVTCADVRGYMNVNLSTIHAYNGRLGCDLNFDKIEVLLAESEALA